MLVILNKNTDAYFNLAAEEYLLTRREEGVIMIWRNENAVIVGRNQITRDEVDKEAVDSRGIKVVRRLTGGGAVYHDLGNINYTFIRRGEGGHFNDYRYFAAPIVAFLHKMGVNAEFSGRNDIIVDGRKISGTAQVKRGDDVLFHGTLLIDTDMSVLTGVLKPDYDKLKRHGIESVASRVANLRELGVSEDAETLMKILIDEFVSAEGNSCYELTDSEIAAISELANAKYSQDDWNYDEITYPEEI